MRKTALVAGVISCAFIFAGSSGHANAESVDYLTDSSEQISDQFELIGLVEEEPSTVTEEQVKVKKKKPTMHVVAKNEALSDIAKQYKTTWVRLFAKNTDIEHPDLIAVGDKIVIPDTSEKLTKRALPEPPVREVAVARTTRQSYSAKSRYNRNQSNNKTTIVRGSSAGNTYSYGYCTWYVKNRRANIPNGLGNAITWVSRAAAMGMATGSTPKAGAVGQQGNHVVYVEKVNGDGTVTISEMNFKGHGVISTRTVSAANFSYIY